MEIKEIYQLMEGSYDMMVNRLRDDALIRKFLLDFLEDKEYEKLENTMQMNDEKAAFDAVHTLKGVALNLELGLISKYAVPLTENLRYGKTPAADDLFSELQDGYQQTVMIIKENIL